MSPKRRKEIAKRAAESRHAKNLPQATHEGPLSIGTVTFDCAIIQYGGEVIRVISQTEFMRALGMYYSGFIAKQHREEKDPSAVQPMFLAQAAIKPYIPKHLDGLQYAPIPYRSKGGSVAKGIPARAIPRICKKPAVFLTLKT